MTRRRIARGNGVRRHAHAAVGIVALSRVEADAGLALVSKWPARAPIPERQQRSAASEQAPAIALRDKFGRGRKH